MRGKIVWAIAGLALVSVGCQANPKSSGYARYGAAVDTGAAVSLAEAVARIDQYAGKSVCVKAKIDDVCKGRGCWMLLADGGHRVRVRFGTTEPCTGAFLVPRNSAGREAYAYGVLKKDAIPEDLARHYAEDEGKSKDEIAKIVGPQPAVTMIASGVMISDSASLEPPAQ